MCVCSEENPVPVALGSRVRDDEEEREETTSSREEGEDRFSVSFDPLDGSSIHGSNFAVGSIFGVWRSASGWKGLRGKDQCAAAYAGKG